MPQRKNRSFPPIVYYTATPSKMQVLCSNFVIFAVLHDSGRCFFRFIGLFYGKIPKCAYPLLDQSASTTDRKRSPRSSKFRNASKLVHPGESSTASPSLAIRAAALTASSNSGTCRIGIVSGR